MADTLMIDVAEDLDVEKLAEDLADSYRAKGFVVTKSSTKNGVRMVFDKGVGGINYVLGMDKGITATITKRDTTLTVNYSDPQWIGKIVGLVVGWFICLVPAITAIIGAIGQLNLPKEINTEITMLADN